MMLQPYYISTRSRTCCPFFSGRGGECCAVAAECKRVVLPAGCMEVMREDKHQVLRQNSAWTLPGDGELTTIIALAGQTWYPG